MSYESDLAAAWRAELVKLRESLTRYEQGHIRTSYNGVDTTPEAIQQLRWTIDNLDRGAAILEGKGEA